VTSDPLTDLTKQQWEREQALRQLAVDEGRLKLEQHRLRLDNRWFVRMFPVLVPAAVSLAGVLITVAQYHSANLATASADSARLDASRRAAIEADRTWRLEILKFVAANFTRITSSDPVERNAMRGTMVAALPDSLALIVFSQLERAAPPAARNTWASARDSTLNTLIARCPPEGDAPSGEVKALNRLKNRVERPGPRDFDSLVTLQAMLAPTADDSRRFSDSRAAELTGYVYRVIPGGRETANCRAIDPALRDTHIELLATPSDTEAIRRVIVEVTPRERMAKSEVGLDWSTTALQSNLVGKWARIRGWLMFDAEHRAQAENTNLGGNRNWRATAWEIHPIISVEVLKKPPR